MGSMFKKPILRLHLYGFVFTSKLLPLIAVIGLVITMLNLSHWQLTRGHYKSHLEKNFAKRGQHLPLDWLKLKKNTAILEYHPVKIQGFYDSPHTFLIDNQIVDHKVGYYVITPFMQVSNNPSPWLLVNRGWVSRGPDRKLLPTLPAIRGEQMVFGNLKIPSSKIFVLGHPQTLSEWPLLLQALDIRMIEKALGHPIYPYLVLLDPKAEAGFLRHWSVTGVTSQKHYAYAIQWLALSLTLVIIYIFANTRRTRQL